MRMLESIESLIGKGEESDKVLKELLLKEKEIVDGILKNNNYDPITEAEHKKMQDTYIYETEYRKKILFLLKQL